MSLLLIALLPLVGALLPAWFIRWGRNQSALAAGAVAASSFVLLLSLAPRVLAGETVRAGWDWIPSLGLRFSFMADGLGFLFAFLILGIGLLVVLYARYYLHPDDPMGRFYAFLLLFMGSMLGVVLSDNLILLLVFWEMTSISSFLLIGYWKHLPEARQGARMALVVTGAGGLALLGGILLVGHVVGSYELSDVLMAGDVLKASPLYLPALVLVLLGAFTKSAQFPFHFWLPHAMAAPTPVSAYLHSATMVKAGVFLLARVFPAFAGTPEWFYLVTGAGLATLLVGAYIALLKDDLKALLAYSTVSHLGLITTLFGLGTRMAAAVGVFHIMNHAAFKASLFMNAGIVDHEAGTRDIRLLGGLGTFMPVSALLALLAAAAMAGVPPMNGFLSKEMFLDETLHLEFLGGAPWIVPVLAVVGAAFSAAYSIRYVADIYGGRAPESYPSAPHDPPIGMSLPVVILVVACVLIGLFPNTVAGPLWVPAAAAAMGGAPPDLHLALWHGFNLPLLMSAVALVGGALLWWRSAPLVGVHQGPIPLPVAKRIYDRGVAGAAGLAHRVTRALENGSLQRYLAILVATALAAVAVPLLSGGFVPGGVAMQPAEPVAVAAWVMLAVGAVGTALAHRMRITAIIFLSVVGLVMSLAFMHFSAPDLALTQISVEVVTIILLLLALHLLPRTSPVESTPARRVRDVVLAVAAGAAVTAVTWLMLSYPLESISGFHLAESKPGGGGGNVVNVILVDFRGFDTFGEVTVLAIAALGIYALVDGLGLPTGWDAGSLEDEAQHPLMLVVIPRLLLPAALLVGLYLFLRGHNQPGGGFIAGLVVSVALILQYIASGMGWTQDRMRRDFHPVIATGVLLAGLTGLGSWFFGVPFLTSWFDHFHLPVLGDFELASAVAFDVGVFLTVVGAVLLVLVNLGRLPGADRVRSVTRGGEP